MGLISSFAALFLSGCGGSPNNAEVRWRMTVEVETPDGIRTGSSVWSWQLAKPVAALTSPYSGVFRGEAVSVDLPNGGTLFALITDQEQLPERHFGDFAEPRDEQNRTADIEEIASRVGEVRQLPCKPRNGSSYPDPDFDCPMLVAFVDPADPMSIAKVRYHDASAILGQGYSIRKILMEITNDPVTTGLHEKLPNDFFRKWAKAKKERRAGMSLSEYVEKYGKPLSDQLSRYDFTREPLK